MISNPPLTRIDVADALRRTAATALFLAALLAASAALAASDFRYGGTVGPTPHDPQSYGPPPAPAGGSADLKTCDRGLVWDAKKKKCLVKRSGVLPDGDLIEYA